MGGYNRDPCGEGVGTPTKPHPTFRVVLVQLVGRLLPVLDALLQRVDQALQQRTVGGSWGSGSQGAGSPADQTP